jgi:hypothetical protein
MNWKNNGGNGTNFRQTLSPPLEPIMEQMEPTSAKLYHHRLNPLPPKSTIMLFHYTIKGERQ